MKKVLIVEDDADINKALRVRLQASGYEVCSAEDGYTGLRAAIQERPDVMILDVSMPAGDGFSIISRLRENTDLPGIPFIILTASKKPDLKRKAAELGAIAFFDKPFESAALIEAVNDAVSGKWQINV